jgi:hypothetical protein
MVRLDVGRWRDRAQPTDEPARGRDGLPRCDAEAQTNVRRGVMVPNEEVAARAPLGASGPEYRAHDLARNGVGGVTIDAATETEVGAQPLPTIIPVTHNNRG